MTMPYETGYWESFPELPTPPEPATPIHHRQLERAARHIIGVMTLADMQGIAGYGRRPITYGDTLPVLTEEGTGVLRTIVDVRITAAPEITRALPPEALAVARSLTVHRMGTPTRTAFDEKTQRMLDEFWYKGGPAMTTPEDDDPGTVITRDVVYMRGIPGDLPVQAAVSSSWYGMHAPRLPVDHCPPMQVGTVYREERKDGSVTLARVVQAQHVAPRVNGDHSPTLLATMLARARAVRTVGGRLLPGTS